MTNQDLKTLESIDKKLDILIALLSDRIVSDINITEAILKLNRLGLDRTNIAKILGTTPLVVSVRISESKRKRKDRE